MLRGDKRITQSYSMTRLSPPMTEPVSYLELKENLRLFEDDENNFLIRAIEQAREEIEQQTGMAFIEQVWEFKLDRWGREPRSFVPGTHLAYIPDHLNGLEMRYIEIPRWPLISVDNLEVFDAQSRVTAYSPSSIFDIDLNSRPPRLALQQGAIWPIALRDLAAIRFTLTVGYGADPCDVPEPIKRAIIQMASWIYEKRGTACSGGDAYIESGARTIMSRYAMTRI